MHRGTSGIGPSLPHTDTAYRFTAHTAIPLYRGTALGRRRPTPCENHALCVYNALMYTERDKPTNPTSQACIVRAAQSSSNTGRRSCCACHVHNIVRPPTQKGPETAGDGKFDCPISGNTIFSRGTFPFPAASGPSLRGGLTKRTHGRALVGSQFCRSIPRTSGNI